MFKDKIIRKKIKEAIDKGASKFVIFPFGENGVAVRNCLRDCFGIEAELIVDNEYSKYNEKIVDIKALKKFYSQDIYVLLTVEDKKLNKKLEEEILEFIPNNRIVNFLDIVHERYNPQNRIGSSLMMDNILPLTIEEKNVLERKYRVGKGKIKVRILHGSLIMWNALRTICEAFENDARFDVLVILGVNQPHDAEIQMEREKHQYVKYQEYCGEIDRPDITIISLICDKYPYDLRRYSTLVVAASMMLIRYAYSIEDFWNEGVESGFNIHSPDYYLFDSMLYRELINGGYQSERIIEMGNAKYDGIYFACQEKRYNVGWEKLKGKTVILWATDHGMYDGQIANDLTFDLYAKMIFEYASENENIGFVIRPHRALIVELLENKYWSPSDLDRLKKYCNSSPNIVFDDTDCYNDAFSVADAVITDINCGVICTALPTLKPICLLYRSKECSLFHPELADIYYAAHDKNELFSFFEMIKNGKDDMLELRRVASKRFVKHFDGKNGERIKAFIEEKYFEMI